MTDQQTPPPPFPETTVVQRLTNGARLDRIVEASGFARAGTAYDPDAAVAFVIAKLRGEVP